MTGKILAVGFVCAGMAAGQTASTPAKAYAFDVVSIRQNKSAPQMGLAFGPTADGYRMTNQSLAWPLLTAYVPQVGGSARYSLEQIKGPPDWLISERYDIDARIADKDIAEWRKPDAQKLMLQTRLQALLAERCKLTVHRQVKEVAVFALVVAKSGLKFKETDPAVEHRGDKLPSGEVVVPGGKDGIAIYGTSMAALASFLSTIGNAGRPIQDKTGLTGRYDVVLKSADTGPASDEQQGVASDPVPTLRWDIKALGLELKPAKGQLETLVIDHMERPSEN